MKLPIKWKIEKLKFKEVIETYFRKEDQAWVETAESETLMVDIIRDINKIIDVLQNLEERVKSLEEK